MMINVFFFVIFSTEFILFVDTNKQVTLAPDRQMCSKVQSILSFGKYQTYQLSSNITYVSRDNSQTFLAYSPLDDILIFIEPKHQLYVYNAQTVRLIVNLTITDIVYVTSSASLISDNQHEIFFLNQTRLDPNLISIRICQMHFDIFQLKFDEIKCIQSLIIHCDATEIRIYGFTIQRNYMNTQKSLLFISTDMGIVYTVFDMTNISLIREPVVLNDTLNEGSVVVTSSGIIYYANKQENTIHEIYISRDFRMRYGKIIKSNAIKSPFGLIADECNHLYIGTKSMILVMFITKYTTIRSIFSKASDLPITFERLNATTYIYATMKKSSRGISQWMFNFIYFTEPDKPTTTTRTTTTTTKDTQESLTLPTNTMLVTTSTIPILFSSQPILSSITDTDLTTQFLSSSDDNQTSSEYITTTSTSLNDEISEIVTSTESIITSSNTVSEFITSTSIETTTIESSTSTELISTSNIIMNDVYESSETDSTTAYLSTITDAIITTDSFEISTNEQQIELFVTTMQTSTLSIGVADQTDISIKEAIYQNDSLFLSSSSSSPVESNISPTSESLLSSPEYSSMNPSLSLDVFSSLDPLFTQSATTTTTMATTFLSTMLTTDLTTFETTEQSTHLDETTELTTIKTTEQSTYIDETTKLTTIETTEQSTYLDETTKLTTIETTEETTTVLDSTSATSTIPDETTLITTDSTTFQSSTIEYTSTEFLIETTVTTLIPDLTTTENEQTTSTQSTTELSSSSSSPLDILTTQFTTILTSTSTSTTTTSLILIPKSKKPRRKTTSTTITTTSTTTITMTTTTTTFWRSRLASFSSDQQTIVLKPTINNNSSNTLLSNDLLQSLFNSTTNSSEDKLIIVDLGDLPPSTWDVSFSTNQSVLLDISLPLPSYPINSNTTTNLNMTNIEANRFSTNIVGLPLNLQIDQVQAKQVSLAMNLIQEKPNQTNSDVIIGRIRSEQFELNITKSDNMNIQVQQVDSETAELFFDDKFCTNESNLQINLNLSKNGTIRFGNRAPIRVGPVFTRVHMLKQSCDLEQPFVVFFDICQGQSPCLNGGTCQSDIPNYDDPSYSVKESSSINYQCLCPKHFFGANCEESQYQMGYCINDGILIERLDPISQQTIEQCLCPSGFNGTHCEINIDDCINIDCSRHGVCVDGISNYTCSCYEGFFGFHCEQKNIETVVLQVASKSFASVAILLIASIAGLIVASDIHTYLTRKKTKTISRVSTRPRATSELFENSVLLLGFGDAPIEMTDLSTIDQVHSVNNISSTRQRSRQKKIQSRYQHLPHKKHIRTTEKSFSSKRPFSSNPAYETIM